MSHLQQYNKRKKIILTITLLLIIVFIFDLDAQCAMCKAAAESDLENNQKSIARGLNKGILFLMAVPYMIVGVIFRKDIVVLIKNIKSKSKEPLSNERKQWLRFALTFATALIILFIIFYRVQYVNK